ncbi:hypothetical protein NEFER03_2122 [Nematocida sp. LUAm3]|nr:hypothetical protein NEFER03_2122 [Nematocida sp. LUAm3]KAI5175626.1 hypothetical protein NEFER02_1513 [Nematocida sp. LUAm2]KAI5178532.1 hypothetical protein NEFER01_1668 [Nematocida sp. LUAm1]
MEENKRVPELLKILMRETEISRKTHNISQEELAEITRGASLFGYKVVSWYDGDFLVLIFPDESPASLTPYDASMLDILVSIADTPGGVKKEEVKPCSIFMDLLREKWIVEENNVYFLSKRAKAEKKLSISSKSSLFPCDFCGILNNEGNIPHNECIKYI